MSRRGFSLVEMLMVVAVIGLMTLIAIPYFRTASSKNSVRGSRNTLAGLYTQSRLIAMQQGRTAGLRFDGNKVFVSTWSFAGGAYDTVGPVRDFAAEFGATVTSNRNPIVVDSKGFATDSATVWASKDGYVDSVQISRYGRMTK